MPSASEIIRKFSELHTLPHVAIRVTQLVNDEKSTMQDFEEIIKLDPVLVSRLLRLVNSPYFGLPQKVDSIAKAVVFAGMKQLRNLVAVDAMRSMFRGEEEGFSPRLLWLHSAMVAIIAEMIAKRIFAQDPEDAFLAAILHDIGLIVENQVAGKELRQACAAFQQGQGGLVACERAAIGADHAEIGALLGKNWGLPAAVLAAIRGHHAERPQKSMGSIASILHLAEFMAAKMGHPPVPGPVAPLPPELARHVKEGMANYRIIIRDIPGEMAKARELYEQG
jgi:putative nucleotidyltransferase with HDIG domain